jgi:translation initiation factor 4G
MDAIEFIDSFVMDSPRAYEYLGNLLGSLLQIKAFDVEWLCEQLEKTKADPDTVAPVKLVRYTITSAGPSAKGSFSAAEKALVGLLGADSWKTISQELLN